MLDSSLGWPVSRVFEGIDCTITDNSPEEIEAAVIEMLEVDHLTGQSKQLSELQTEFDNLRSKYSDTGGTAMSETFIQEYSLLLSLKTQTYPEKNRRGVYFQYLGNLSLNCDLE